jgi:hypothetical protein
MRGVNILPILHDELTRYRSQLTISDENLVFGTSTGRPHCATNVQFVREPQRPFVVGLDLVPGVGEMRYLLTDAHAEGLHVVAFYGADVVVPFGAVEEILGEYVVGHLCTSAK